MEFLDKNGTSLLDAARQGKVSSVSGLIPAISQSQTSFRSVSTDAIKKELEKDTTALRGYTNSSGSLYGVVRKPWIFTTFEALDSLSSVSKDTEGNVKVDWSLSKDNDKQKTIFLAINPSSVNWTVSQRGVEAKNKSGTVHHYWYDSTRKTYFDDPKITFNFQTGNIMPLPGQSDPLYNVRMKTRDDGSKFPDTDDYSPVNKMSPGLKNFYQFLSLVDQQKITTKGAANFIHILYRSNIFPSMVLTGLFDPQVVVQFQDDSQNPYKITGWTATFTVFSTTPKLNNYAELSKAFIEEFGNVVE